MQYELEGQEISRPHELTVLKKHKPNQFRRVLYWTDWQMVIRAEMELYRGKGVCPKCEQWYVIRLSQERMKENTELFLLI